MIISHKYKEHSLKLLPKSLENQQ